MAWKSTSDSWAVQNAMIQNQQYDRLLEKEKASTSQYPGMGHLVNLDIRAHPPKSPPSKWRAVVELMMQERKLKDGKDGKKKWVDKKETLNENDEASSSPK